MGKFGITANAVAPGFHRHRHDRRHAARVGMGLRTSKAAAATQIPVQRVGEPTTSPNAVAFFHEQAAGFVSGQVLYVAGDR